ncbi:TPA: sugar ABC transporter substrate-binding protein [Candidatus Poribacteria bacterium]|nr:sugar ABC transporter substrate-binding protein [Candidatus Poribacteria bacterium]HEX29225.1 sugar ABC transporter substrate-binding protein [Candidatus Poribacteria bacterium]
MKAKGFKFISAGLLMLVALTLSGYAKEDVTLTIMWADWEPAHLLLKLAKDFTKETGIKVRGNFVPWPQYHDKMFTEFASHRTSFDLCLPDSQWIGEAVEGGHLLDLTDWIREKVDLNNYPDMVMRSYGEYPDGSGRYYGVPGLLDFVLFAYRKDLFDDPKEKAAFKEKYGYELGVPETWEQVRDIAEFFTRPDKNLYGIALWQAPLATAGLVDEFLGLFWSKGGRLWSGRKGKKVVGYLNDEAGYEAAKLWAELYKYHPKGAANYSVSEVLTAMQQGLVAMIATYAAFYPALLDPEKSLYYDKIGFFTSPAGIDPSGKKHHYVQLGGQGMSISAYTPYKEECKKFLEWWLREDTQWKFAEAGQITPDKRVVENDKFLKLAPINRVVRESLPLLRDFWEIPEYNEMAEYMSRKLNQVCLGQITPKEAMDDIARKHEEILRARGYY